MGGHPLHRAFPPRPRCNRLEGAFQKSAHRWRERSESPLRRSPKGVGPWYNRSHTLRLLLLGCGTYRASKPLGEITLPVQFGTASNYRVEHINFYVADFNNAYHAILGRPALAKFMDVPHYAYLVLKMPSLAGVLALRANLSVAYACGTESLDLGLDDPSKTMKIGAHLDPK